VATVEDAAGPSLRCWRGQTQEVDIAGTANQPEAAADGTYDMLCAFIDQLAEGKSPTPSIDDAMPAADLTFQIATELLQTAGA
jgi:hypothetical protein